MTGWMAGLKPAGCGRHVALMVGGLCGIFPDAQFFQGCLAVAAGRFRDEGLPVCFT